LPFESKVSDSVAARLQAEARRSGRPLKVVVNEHLRAALAHRKALKALPPFRVEPRNMGGGPAPGLSYDNVGALVDEIEGSRRR